MNVLTTQLVFCAARYVGTKEKPANRGPEVEAWQARVSGAPGDAWCAAFAWSMVDDACTELGRPNMLPKARSVHKLWERAPRSMRLAQPIPGSIFCHDSGFGKGHCGIVVEVLDGSIKTIEGNTGPDGSREGDGVYRKTRPLSYVNLGYLDPSAAYV